MEFQDVIHKRKMIRSYLDKPVERETVDFILENAIRAPSAGFSQGWGFLVLDEPEDLKRFWESNWPDRREDSRWLTMEHAPVIIIPLAHKQAYLDRYAEPDKGWTDRDETRWPVPYWHVDAGFAALLMLLTAVDEGLGACFFGIPPDRTAAYRSAFDVPETLTPIGAITFGYRAADRLSPSLKRGRRPVQNVAHFGRWGQVQLPGN